MTYTINPYTLPPNSDHIFIINAASKDDMKLISQDSFRIKILESKLQVIIFGGNRNVGYSTAFTI